MNYFICKITLLKRQYYFRNKIINNTLVVFDLFITYDYSPDYHHYLWYY